MVKKVIKTNPNLIELINKLYFMNNQEMKMQLFGEMLHKDLKGLIEEPLK